MKNAELIEMCRRTECFEPMLAALKVAYETLAGGALHNAPSCEIVKAAIKMAERGGRKMNLSAINPIFAEIDAAFNRAHREHNAAIESAMQHCKVGTLGRARENVMLAEDALANGPQSGREYDKNLTARADALVELNRAQMAEEAAR